MTNCIEQATLQLWCTESRNKSYRKYLVYLQAKLVDLVARPLAVSVPVVLQSQLQLSSGGSRCSPRRPCGARCPTQSMQSQMPG